MVKMESWGRIGSPEHTIVPLIAGKATSQLQAGKPNGLAYGMGRSYGDVCLNPGHTIWTTTGLDHFRAFDETTGKLTCESGVLLRDIQRTFIPRGWMLPVVPGTQLITVGGAIANDIHGKNHHVHGTFGHHVTSIKLARTDGEIRICTPQKHKDMFAATVAGLGLTGVILEAELQLIRTTGPWLETESIPFTSLKEFFELADESEAEWEHTVSWIDCLSTTSSGTIKGLFMRGNPAAEQPPAPTVKKPLTVPFVPPVSLINRVSLGPFNFAYYHLKKMRSGRALTHYESFFHPLDAIQHWNRLYGPPGFYQYQCVVPRGAIQTILNTIARAGEGSFLAVLKTFGNKPSLGLLSFPQPGVTLALDFPNNGPRTLTLLKQLDDIVREAKGRIYPAKDATMPRDLFESGYPNYQKFQTFRDPNISSAFSRRLMGN